MATFLANAEVFILVLARPWHVPDVLLSGRVLHRVIDFVNLLSRGGEPERVVVCLWHRRSVISVKTAQNLVASWRGDFCKNKVIKVSEQSLSKSKRASKSHCIKVAQKFPNFNCARHPELSIRKLSYLTQLSNQQLSISVILMPHSLLYFAKHSACL